MFDILPEAMLGSFRRAARLSICIRITTTPSGFAPENTRNAWVGVEMPAVTEDSADANKDLDSDTNKGGFLFYGSDAVAALLDAGRIEAAAFWEHQSHLQHSDSMQRAVVCSRAK